MSFSFELPSEPSSPSAPFIKVEACKFDNSVHRTWQVQLESETEDLWIFKGVFEKEIRHPLLGIIRPGTISVEFYWKNRCYNVFRFHEPEGQLRNFYCNVNLPPILTGGVLSYVDLDIDVLVQPDLSYQVVDLDEFADNAARHRYPPEIIKTAHDSLNQIILLVERRGFPFNFKT
jgi:protein associated with RNAse G/E